MSPKTNAIPITFVLLGLALLSSGAGAQDVRELQNQIDRLTEELEEVRALRKADRELLRGSDDELKLEIATLKETVEQLRTGMTDVVPEYIGDDQEDFEERIQSIMDERFRDYSRGTGWLKGEPAEDELVDRISKSLSYLTIGAEQVTAAQVFSGLDPFDDRPNLQRALSLTRLSLQWRPSDKLSGRIEGQWFGNFGASDTRFEDYYLVTPRTGTALDLPIRLTQPGDITDPDLDPLILSPDNLDIPNDVLQLYQAHVDIKQLFGLPIGVRAGRQEMVLGDGAAYGNEFLYGNNDSGDLFFGQSFDGGKLMLANSLDDPTLTVDAWWYKPDELEESAFLEDDSSPDFVGVYGSFTGLAGNELLGKAGIDLRVADLSWTLVRNPATTDRQVPSPLPFGLRNTFFGNSLFRNDPAQRFIDRSFADVRFLESDELMTLSTYMQVGFGDRVTTDINLAFQYGDTARKRLTASVEILSPVDGSPISIDSITLPSGDYEAYAADIFTSIDLAGTVLDVELGENTSLAPNLGFGYAYFSGGTIDDFLTGDINTFQRLVSDRQYGEIIDRAPFGTFLSNAHVAQVKLGLTLSERVSFDATGYGYWVDKPTDPNGPFMGANHDIFQLRESLLADLEAFREPGDPDPSSVISALTSSQQKPRRNLGFELDTLLTYNHSEQTSVYFGYNHFWDGGYFRDVLPDRNTVMHELFGEEFGSQFDVKGGKGQDYWFLQIKVDF